MDDEYKLHTLFEMTRRRAPHNGVTYRKPLGSAKATDPKDLLMVLALSMGSNNGHCRLFQSSSEEGKHGIRENEA